jgi:dihydrofolate synthase/folylpolyglutamate synthase
MRFSTMTEWLNWIASIHNTSIELGLLRVKKVADRLNLLNFSCPVVMVGGTNGKGSTVAGLASIYKAAGYRVGTFTSPFLFKLNEQVKIDGIECDDAHFCQAFEKVESVRGDISLTSFEFQTLAALVILKSHSLDLIILEVGLGGRLDAVNIIDADLSIITSIDLDHTEWLGETREAIAIEKAGIMRSNKPVVCGDDHPPHTLIDVALQLKSPIYIQGREFRYQKRDTVWDFQSKFIQLRNLPIPTLALQNMACVVMAVSLLRSQRFVSEEAIRSGLTSVHLIGRVQIMKDPITTIWDVSHNPASVLHLSSKLKELSVSGKTRAVFSMLNDKDIVASLLAISEDIDIWHTAPLTCPRAASKDTLEEAFLKAGISSVHYFSSLREAYQAAQKASQAGDRIIVFGSFHTVSEIANGLDNAFKYFDSRPA